MKVVAIGSKKCYIINACMKYNEGVNTMIQSKLVKRLALFTLIFASLLTLAACGSSLETPYGSVSNDVYLTLGDITVTEKELYDQLRLQGASVLANMIDEKVFEDEILAVKTILSTPTHPEYEQYMTYFDEQVNSAIHRSTNLEAIEKLYNDSPTRFVKNVASFKDSLYLLDNSIDLDALQLELDELAVPYKGYAGIETLLNRYALRAAQRYYAQTILTEELADESSSVFIKETDIFNYYKTNNLGRFDVNALVIRFINLNEANAALYKESIKADSRGYWYLIPDIRIADENDPRFIDLTDESEDGYGHVKTILSELGILSKLDSDEDPSNGNDFANREKISVLDFENYYKKYAISTNRTNGRQDIARSTVEVKEHFVNIYNFLNTGELEFNGSIHTEILVKESGLPFEGRYSYDDLTAMNASLRSHVYNTLLTESDMADPEDTLAGKPYSGRIQTFGSSRYLVFKLNDDSEQQTVVYDKTADAFTTHADVDTLKAEIREKLEIARLSTAYISSKITTLYKEISLDIYDNLVRAIYEQNYGYDGTTKNRSGNVLAKIDGKEILVDDFFNRLEQSYGINLALDLGSNKFLMASEDYTITAAEMTSYKEQFEGIISQFSADNFASAGYPASMGREQFLLTAFGARSNAEAIDQLYVYPNLRQQYLSDMEAHYGEGIYAKLALLAEKQYNNFASINVSHLLVYFDKNGDGTPDNPNDYLDQLSAAERTLVLDGLVELVREVYAKVGNYKGFAEGLSALAAEFNNSGRIPRGNNVVPLTPEELRLDYQIELTWAEYRKLGFYLKFENIGSAITNTSNMNVSTNNTSLDPVFYTRAMELHDLIKGFSVDESRLPYLDLYADFIDLDELNKVQSAFGWHLILATSLRDRTSAKFEVRDDEDGRYENAAGLNIYNANSETLTASQIKYYLTEQKTDEGVVLPTSVQTTVTNYLTPVLTRYNGTFMQRELIFVLLNDATFANGNRARFDMIRTINKRQMNEYLTLDYMGNPLDANYAALYGDWFAILEG
jgi:hypothetical protein